MPSTTSNRTPRRFRRQSGSRRALVGAIGIAVAALVAAGCLPPPPAPPSTLAPMTIGVTHAVASRDYTFVDTTRGTPAFGAFPGSSSRRIPTTVWYPSDGGGPFPLVMFLPGYGVTGADYSALITRIAAAGYVVAAPAYPLLSGQPAGPTDTVGWADLAPDTWFVTTEVLARSAAGDAGIGGLIDPARIAVAGHSDGAAVAFEDGYTPWRLDWRVRAVVAYGVGLQYYGPYQANGRPILHVISDQDVYNPYGETIGWDQAYLQEPKTVVSLWNASHEGPFMNAGDPHFEAVAVLTVGWLDTMTKAHPEALFFAGLYLSDHPELGAFS